MTQHEEQTGETEVEPELEQAKRKLGEGQIHRKSLERSFVCGFEGMSISSTARWLSWLERRPVTAEVDGSNPFRVAPLKESERMYDCNAFSRFLYLYVKSFY